MSMENLPIAKEQWSGSWLIAFNHMHVARKWGIVFQIDIAPVRVNMLHEKLRLQHAQDFGRTEGNR